MPKNILETISDNGVQVHDTLANITSEGIKGLVKGDNTFLKDALNDFLNAIIAFIPKLLVAILILWIGFRLIKLLKKAITKIMKTRSIDISLQGFILAFIDILLKILLIITVMGIVGIEATSFIAMLGAAGLAIGMALQGTLQNFAGGVIILILKPFRVNDYIECAGFSGTVKEIKIFNTTLATADNKIVIIPNTSLATSSLINYSQEGMRRVDVSVGIAYGESIANARQILLDLTADDIRIFKDPEPIVIVSGLGNSSVDLQLRIWTCTNDYWNVKFEMTERIYTAFKEKGIEIPFPQVQVHMEKR